MACPECKCETTYSYYDDDELETDLERCAHCGHIFDELEALDDEEE